MAWAAPLSFDVKLEGDERTRLKLREMQQKMPDAFAGGVYLWACNVVSTAMKLTPFETGFLRGSRYVTKPSMSSSTFTIEIGFSAPYAIFVHEINRNYVAGEWKFLTKALNYHSPTAMKEIGRLTQRMFATRQGISTLSPLHPTDPFVGPAPPRTTRRRPGETRKAHHARTRKFRRQRAKGREKNRDRIAGELIAMFEAQASGRPAPRPGRGGK